MSLESSLPPPRALRLHIGHHFFGAGNLGDDLMLAGFLQATSQCGDELRLTCCSPFDSGSQPRRFPQIDWLAYDLPSRESAIAACDAWVGVGGTPFQVAVGTWFLDHLTAELELCRKYKKPMFYIGVGVDEPAALENSQARNLLGNAIQFWTRDPRSAELILAAGARTKVTAAADLAHIYFSSKAPLPIEQGTVGYVLNFEDLGQFDPRAFCALSTQLAGYSQRWLVQECRMLDGSESAIYASLPSECKSRLELRAPDYQNGTIDAMLESWGSFQTLISSRYHACLIGAWAGARVVAVERSEKIRGLAAQFGIVSVPSLRDAGAVLNAIDRSRPIEHEQLLVLADRASRSCQELISVAAKLKTR